MVCNDLKVGYMVNFSIEIYSQNQNNTVLIDFGDGYSRTYDLKCK